MSRLLLALITLALTLGEAQICFADADPQLAAGRHIYRTATRPDGTAVRALVQMDVALPSAAAACSNCHRRSGIGVSEGGLRSLNLTASALFEPTDKAPLRPAYDDATLIRAIVAGIAPDGRILDMTMPRYELSADDSAALVAYLRGLGVSAPAGVTDTDIHIATVVSADAPDHERAAVIAVMQRYVEIKNGESRRESERAAASNRHLYGRSRQRAYRTWQLHVWSLDGPEASWPKQLEVLYGEAAPFAIVSGAAGSSWSIIDGFCEQHEIPCLLPLSNVPPEGKPGFYSLHFSTGVALDASVTARHIIDSELPTDTKILVVHNEDVAGQVALDTLRSQLAIHNYKNISARSIKPNKSLSGRKWRSLLKTEGADVLVSWAPASMLSSLVEESSGRVSLPKRIYTAQSFSDWAENVAPHELLRERVRHVYPYSLPRAGLTQFPREEIWLKLQGLSELNSVAAAKVLFACRALGVGLADIQSTFSREYLVESLEHALDATQLTSVFPRTSLGPDQRFLNRGAYVVTLSGNANEIFSSPVWVRP